MRARPLLLEATTARNRFAVMGEIDDWVVSAGGWIEGHTLLANLVITFRFVVPASAIGRIDTALEALAIHLDTPSKDRIAGHLAIGLDPATEQPGSLAISFVHDEPDLKREIPAVPG